MNHCTLLLIGISSFLASAQFERTMDSYLQAWTSMDMFSGTVLVSKDGNIVFHKAYGKANVGQNVENTCETRFRIGSLTKSFTAMVVLQLEQQGLLRTTDRLSKYIPDHTQADEITLDMLLNHRSGIVDHTTLPDFQTHRRTDVCPLEETIATFKGLPLEFPPGTRFEYSNSNYILLGFIIEKVTKRPYAETVRHHLLEPFNMDRTGFEYKLHPVPNMAVGYRMDDDRIVPAPSRVMQNAHASGGLYSTASDLYAWEKVFNSDDQAEKAILQKLLDPAADAYSYGWAIDSMHGRRILAHMGDTEGFKSCILRFPADSACIIVLSNFDHCLVMRIGHDLSAILLGQPYRVPKRTLAGREVAAHYDDYVGQYQLKPGFVFTISREGTRLYCQATGQGRLQLHPESQSTFFIREADANFAFVRDEKGRVTKLVLNQNGRQISVDKL